MTKREKRRIKAECAGNRRRVAALDADEACRARLRAHKFAATVLYFKPAEAELQTDENAFFGTVWARMS